MDGIRDEYTGGEPLNEESVYTPDAKKVAPYTLHDDECLDDEFLYVETDHLITEDDEPVDNVFSEKQQRLLVEPLYTGVSLWNTPPERTFIACCNVGIFAANQNPAIVPDALLSVNVSNRRTMDFGKIWSYFAWYFGKLPDVVIEIVSNRKGGEMERKVREYARLHIPYYVVFDPFGELRGETLVLHELYRGVYKPVSDFWFEELNIGLRLWEGEYEDIQDRWLRWCDARGNVIPTGVELSAQERSRADEAVSRADEAVSRADEAVSRASELDSELQAERERSARLAEQLRALGINPDAQ
jgi:Uma2 family endonuclease